MAGNLAFYGNAQYLIRLSVCLRMASFTGRKFSNWGDPVVFSKADREEQGENRGLSDVLQEVR